jgi:hypothetical protein
MGGARWASRVRLALIPHDDDMPSAPDKPHLG